MLLDYRPRLLISFVGCDGTLTALPVCFAVNTHPPTQTLLHAQITQGEVEYLLQKVGSVGSTIVGGALDMAQVVVQAGIDLLGDKEYQQFLEQVSFVLHHWPTQTQLIHGNATTNCSNVCLHTHVVTCSHAHMVQLCAIFDIG